MTNFVYIFYWTFPQFEGPSEGQFIRAEACKNIPEAMGKALLWFDNHPNSKVEIVQVPDPIPEEFLTKAPRRT